MKKRLLALMMTGMLAVGMLAGCGSSDAGGATQEAPAEKEESAAQAQEQEEAGQEESKEPESADGGEKVTLRMIEKDVSPEDPVYQEWMERFNAGLEEAGINAQIELVSLQSGTYSENLALLLNSGDIPDIIYFQGGDEDFALNQQIL